ncbi:MAG: GntR family transcriptional regulator [Anaerolineae bacterium]|nr:GntR family transcriptional regulator [Anaerolineae bacterium]
MANTSTNNLSLSQRLHEQLRQLIGETLPGERLPSEPSLAKQLKVSRATLREAMRTFETQGMIHRRQGVGTFVTHPRQVIETGLEKLESIHTLAERIDLKVEMGKYHIDHRPAVDEEAAILGLEPGKQVVQVNWVMEAASRPAAYLVDILPDDILSPKAIYKNFSGSILDMLLDRKDMSLDNSRTEVNAVAAQSDVARALGIQRGDVVLYFKAILYNSAGRVVDLSHSYFLPGYFRFHINRRVGEQITIR